jgi:uncharacterized protein YqiB (DUF1249 family)
MQDETLLPVSWRSRPRSFVALMSLYESNYIRLHALCGKVTQLSGGYRSIVSGDCDLILEVMERAPYTTTLSMTYLLPDAATGSLERYPDVRIRVYADARLAEAQQWANHAGHPALRALGKTWARDAERELDQRWSQNMMLNKWLDYCMERGHRFA